MRIATFNINGINTRLPNLLPWLEVEAPDVVCLQGCCQTNGNLSPMPAALPYPAAI